MIQWVKRFVGVRGIALVVCAYFRRIQDSITIIKSIVEECTSNMKPLHMVMKEV